MIFHFIHSIKSKRKPVLFYISVMLKNTETVPK